MATYKVIQDIEAEDKLIGPLTLRQFIYAAIVLILGFIGYKLSFALKTPYVFIVFLPPMAFFGLLAAPFGNDQPNEIWLLAKFKFFLKPQTRKWDQDGQSSLVTVNVPKTIPKKLTKDITYKQAKSKLETLAKTLDGGGWTAQNASSSLYVNPLTGQDQPERLVNLSTMVSGQPTIDIVDQDDMFSESNLQAQHIGQVMSENEKKIRDYQVSLIQQSHGPKSSSEKASLKGLLTQTANNEDKGYLKEAPIKSPFSPIESTFKPKIMEKTKDEPAVTTQTDNAKINVLARDNNLSIASIDRELRGGDDSKEVVISLHLDNK
jgi:hypothetical protein